MCARTQTAIAATTKLRLLLLLLLLLLAVVEAAAEDGRVGLQLQEEEEEGAVEQALLLMLRGLFKGRRRRQRAKSRIRLAPTALHVSHVTCHMSSHVARYTSQAFYANHNRKRGALRKENMRLVGAPLHCSRMTRCNV